MRLAACQGRRSTAVRPRREKCRWRKGADWYRGAAAEGQPVTRPMGAKVRVRVRVRVRVTPDE